MPRKHVSDEIKQEVLRKHFDEGRTVKSLCDEYFLAHSTVERWITEYRKECQKEPELKKQSEIYEENRKLRKECILRSPTDSDAFQSGRYAEHIGRPKTLGFIV